MTTNWNGSRKLNATTPVRFINTSMHGVSDLYVKRAFEIFGFASYVPVKEQQEPNPDFPTVRFPNPEEKGALVNFLPCVFSFLPSLNLRSHFPGPRACYSRTRGHQLCARSRPWFWQIRWRRARVRCLISDEVFGSEPSPPPPSLPQPNFKNSKAPPPVNGPFSQVTN